MSTSVTGRRTSTNQWRYYAKDHLGSTRAVVTNTGSIVEVRDYYPYGLHMPGRSMVSGAPAKEGFTGHELDGESGLIYAGARYYIPNIGRWTGVDPLADKYPGWSPYNYVLNNPLIMIDPDGMAACRSMECSARWSFGWAEPRWNNTAHRIDRTVQETKDAIATAIHDTWELNVVMPMDDIGQGLSDLRNADNFQQAMDATLVISDGLSDLSATGTLATLPLAKFRVPQTIAVVGTAADVSGVVASGINAAAFDGEGSEVAQRAAFAALNFGSARLTQFVVARQSNRLIRQLDPEAAGAAVGGTVGTMTNQREQEDR